MTVVNICRRHRLRYPVGQRCPRCPAKNRGWEWTAARARVLARDGYRCAVLVNGVRCPETTDLEVMHVGERRIDGGSDTDDTLLATGCHDHHVLLERARHTPA